MSVFNKLFGSSSSEDKRYEENGLRKLKLNDYKGALQEFKSAIEYNPHNLSALFQIGNIYTIQKNPYAAIQIFEGLIKLSSNRQINSHLDSYYYYLGYNYYTLLDFTKSLLFLTRAEELIEPSFPHLPQLYQYRGVSLLHLGKITESIRDFNKALQLKIDYEEAYSFRAYAFMQLKMYDTAIIDYSHAAFYKPNPTREDFEVYTNYAVCLYNVGKYEEAKLKFIKALELNPNNEVARNGLDVTNKKLGITNAQVQSRHLESEEVESFCDSTGQIFFLGETVRHIKFGEGKVLQIFKQGGSSKAIIDFGDTGKKTLLANFVKLSKLEE